MLNNIQKICIETFLLTLHSRLYTANVYFEVTQNRKMSSADEMSWNHNETGYNSNHYIEEIFRKIIINMHSVLIHIALFMIIIWFATNRNLTCAELNQMRKAFQRGRPSLTGANRVLPATRHGTGKTDVFYR